MIRSIGKYVLTKTAVGLDHPAVGEIYHSEFFNKDIVVSRVLDNKHWYFNFVHDATKNERRSDIPLTYFQKKKIKNYKEVHRSAVKKTQAEMNRVYQNVAQDCINGVYLNGDERIRNLRAIGFNDIQIQRIQNIINNEMRRG